MSSLRAVTTALLNAFKRSRVGVLMKRSAEGEVEGILSGPKKRPDTAIKNHLSLRSR